MNSEEKTLRRFDVSVFLHFIGRLIYMTFVPIVLLENGYSLTLVLIYIIGYSVITVVLSLASVKFFLKKKILWFYLLAIVSEIILVFLLLPANISYVVLGSIALLQGVYYTYYYISYDSILAHYTSRRGASNNIGNLNIIVNISNIVAPLIGAFLLTLNKFSFIIVAAIFLVLSIIPLLKIKDVDINGAKLKKIRPKSIGYELFSYGIVEGISFVAFTIWSIFIYVSGFSLIYVGLVPSLESFAQILLIKTIKKDLVSVRVRTITKIISVIGVIAISIYRFIFPSQIVFTNFAIALFLSAFALAVTSDYFEKIKDHQTYYSSILFGIAGFGSWVILGVVVLFIGLKYSILLSVVLALIWFAFSFKRIHKGLAKNRLSVQ